MDLLTYLEKAERGTAARIARAVGVSPVMVSQWASGVKSPVPLERCVAIEQATLGCVMRWDLRPQDWKQHWPELAKKRNAPKAVNVQRRAPEEQAEA